MITKKSILILVCGISLGSSIVIQQVNATQTDEDRIATHFKKRFYGKLSWGLWVPGGLIFLGSSIDMILNFLLLEPGRIIKQDLIPFIIGAGLLEGSHALYYYSKLPSTTSSTPKVQQKEQVVQ